MGNDTNYRAFFEEILDEFKRDYSYKNALESKHRIQLFPALNSNDDSFRLYIEHEGMDIYLKVEGGGHEEKIYSPSELSSLIKSSGKKISLKEVTERLLCETAHPLGQYLANKSLSSFETYLLREYDR